MVDENNNISISEYLSLKGGPKYMSIMAVIDSIGFIDDDRPITDFFNNVTLKYPSRIVIETFTIEGEPIFKIIEFYGKKFKYVYDASKTINKYIKTYKGNNYKKVYEDNSIAYDLYNDNKFVVRMIFYKNYIKLLRESGSSVMVDNIDENNIKISGVVVQGNPEDLKKFENNNMIKHAILGNVIDEF